MRFIAKNGDVKVITLEQNEDTVVIAVNGVSVAFFDDDDATLTVCTSALQSQGLSLYEK